MHKQQKLAWSNRDVYVPIEGCMEQQKVGHVAAGLDWTLETCLSLIFTHLPRIGFGNGESCELAKFLCKQPLASLPMNRSPLWRWSIRTVAGIVF